ncbi:YhgE/Pip domain-containing protein [Alteribacter populi]|uniref:YhgE/Pip domain-containing protein n=1 Tax=Alteribacter populi TaxID=2011011 RepID=UPI000BBAF0A0|nr:YhgE/Pip domain-containing protein [Alteribacter populi]
MNGLRHEIKGIVTSKKLLVALIGIMLMPLLYGGALIWSFWDPYGQIEDLPVAVVNEDRGATQEGEEIAAGEEFVSNLREEATLDFHFVSEDEARRGMKEFDYYFYVKIPETFSEDITSVIDNEPAKGTLYYEVNEDYNYVSSQIADNAIDAMEQQLSEALTLAYVEVANDSFSTFTKHIYDLEKATESLLSGNKGVLDGGNSLNDGLLELSLGTEELAEGIGHLSAGTAQLEDEWLNVTETMEHSNELDHGKNAFTSIREKTEELEYRLEQGELEQIEAHLNDWLALVEGLEHSVENVNHSMNEGAGKVESFQNELEKQRENLARAAEGIDEQKVSVQNMYDSSKVFADNVELFLDEASFLLSEPIEAIEELEDHYHTLPTLLNAQFPGWEEDEDLVNWYESGLGHFEEAPVYQKELETHINDMNRQIGDFRNQVENGEQTIEEVLKGFDESSKAIEDIMPLFSKYKDTFAEIETALDSFENALHELNEAGERLQRNKDIKEMETAFYQSMVALNDEFDHLESIYETALERQDEVTNGLALLSEGAQDASEGALSLQEGVSEAHNGGQDLVKGLENVTDGAGEVHSSVTDVSDFTSDIDPSRQHELMFSSPIESKSTHDEKGYSYGEGLTPYFLSIGLYVGALTLSIIYPFREPLGSHENGVQWFFGKLGVVFLVGLAQVSILLVFLLFILDLTVQSPLAFIGFTYMVSFVFMSLIFMLVGVLDNPGRFIAIILLILQLGGSGGTFPVELLASPLQSIHGWLPMTYSVLGFRSVIFMDSPVLLGRSMLFLSILALITLALAFYFYYKKYRSLCEPNIPSVKESNN